MIKADLDKCVGCGCCQMVCPREALLAYGQVRIDTNRCTDCYDGIYKFEKNEPLSEREAVLDNSLTHWFQLCIYNCPMEALSLENAQ